MKSVIAGFCFLVFCTYWVGAQKGVSVFSLKIPDVTLSAPENLQNGSESQRRFKLGIVGSAGYSLLYLHDDVRPYYTTSEYYSFEPDLFITVGGIIRYYPAFLRESSYFQIDPGFTKYSFGSYRLQRYDTLISKVDVDAEGINLPVSVRFGLPEFGGRFKPYLGGGYSLSIFIHTEAEFISKYEFEEEYVELKSTEFDFSNFQNTLFFTIGTDIKVGKLIFFIEIAGEMGDGLHRKKFQHISNTRSIYTKMGLLF